MLSVSPSLRHATSSWEEALHWDSIALWVDKHDSHLCTCCIIVVPGMSNEHFPGFLAITVLIIVEATFAKKYGKCPFVYMLKYGIHSDTFPGLFCIFVSTNWLEPTLQNLSSGVSASRSSNTSISTFSTRKYGFNCHFTRFGEQVTFLRFGYQLLLRPIAHTNGPPNCRELKSPPVLGAETPMLAHPFPGFCI